MDPRMLSYYNRELQHLREMGAEFAKEFPKIAGRLSLDGFECADPYTERLLESFGFMAARVQLKLDAEFPRFSQHLLEMVYPHYLSPTPSMTVVEFKPNLNDGSLTNGFRIPRDSHLRSQIIKGEQTACEYRTAHDLTLWPLEITKAEYISNVGALATLNLPSIENTKAGIRLKLRCTGGLTFDQIPLEHLQLYLRGTDQLPMYIYEQLIGNCEAVVVRSVKKSSEWYHVVKDDPVTQVGFDRDEALLPFGPQSFDGYRLLQEYFAMPERFMFVQFNGLISAVSRCQESEIEIVIMLNRSEPFLEKNLVVDNFVLFCTPAINLFQKRTDRIHLSDKTSEDHVVPDRTRPMDFEVHSVNGVKAYGAGNKDEQEFMPFYSTSDTDPHGDRMAYYTLYREPRILSEKQRRVGARSTYIGSEVYISLVDAQEAPYSNKLKQLSLNTLCTNRDLPLQMPIGQGRTDFTLEKGAPEQGIRCIAGPTRPRPSIADAEMAWRLIRHLSLNYISLQDNDDKQGAVALQELLKLYSDSSDSSIRKQTDGIVSISTKRITRRLPASGPITFARGLEVTLVFEEAAFEGTGVFLLGSVLDHFFSRYVSINSFIETVIKTTDRGEIMRWPNRLGKQQIL